MNNLWPSNRLTKLLHLDFPIIQSPMTTCCTPQLVESICYAGGLGSFGVSLLSPEEIKNTIKHIRSRTRKRFSLSLYCFQDNPNIDDIIKVQTALNSERKAFGLNEHNSIPEKPYDIREQINALIESKVPVFSFSLGHPNEDEILRCKQNNITLIGTATNLQEVEKLDHLDIDAIVLQGAESGGIRSTFIGSHNESMIGLIDFIPLAKQKTKKPLIAAGGIMRSDQIAACLILGAEGVQLGTVFLASTESGASQSYKHQLLHKKHSSTVITSFFTGIPARVLSTESTLAWDEMPTTNFPYQSILMKDLAKRCQEIDRTDFIPLFAGQGFPLISSRSSIEIFYELAQGTSLLFKELKQE
ncbi:MAG: nitronate monooxygenase [Chlamydiae bacterium]|nr:nitronate monooxygenase [Chlamydiota bacterium]